MLKKYLRDFKNLTIRKVQTMLNAIRQFVKEEEGATAAEYALLLAVVTLAIAGGAALLGTNIGIAINDAAQIVGS